MRPPKKLWYVHNSACFLACVDERHAKSDAEHYSAKVLCYVLAPPATKKRKTKCAMCEKLVTMQEHCPECNQHYRVDDEPKRKTKRGKK